MIIRRLSSFLSTIHTSFVAILLLIFSPLTYAAPSLIPAPPQIAASSYILIDASSGNVLVQQNADQRLPPASLSKIMTSYVAAHELDQNNIRLDDKVRISVNAWKKGGSKMYVREGTSVTVEDLLRGVIIQSGNDASIALAEHIAGSEDAFADLMNRHAYSLGLKNTHFMNATGWPAENHYSSAADLTKLARAYINDFPERYTMYSEKEFTYNEITQPNRNLLLRRDPSVDGMKTGHTEEAGYCLVSSAQRDGMRLIAAVMGTKSALARADESQKLLTYGFRFFETHSTYTAGETITDAPIWMGATDTLPLGLSEDLVITIPRGQKDNLTAKVTMDDNIRAPAAMGQQYGILRLMLDDKLIAEKPLVALEPINEGSLMQRLWHWIYLFVMDLFKR